ncbi:hypothetical protein F5144DRAFT_570785 [Chaetomium tenue]|uniref:Uncharacterized protein n=1 Tax=Chaetomium tenue TaxID=1854479 RepID=A0ACB7P9Y1_9PEZI|nr:hypothetical protein F5144DRAFT_570785 [Chaetomium globosum]
MSNSRRAQQLPYLPPLPPPLAGPVNRTTNTMQQNQSRFFRLPLELQRLILREAFGGHTIHINLIAPPLVDLLPVKFRTPWRRMNIYLIYWRWLARRLTGKPPPRWTISSRYFSYDGIPQVDGMDVSDRHLSTIPGDGFDGGPRCWRCDEPPSSSAARKVGVMGFLRSCQRAYGEALLILYTTNTIAINNGHFFNGLLRQSTIPTAPRIIGPGMRLVTSLQVRSQLILWHPADDAWMLKNRALLAEQLELLPRAFPNLRSLTWIPDDSTYPCGFLPSRRLGELEEILLRPLLRLSATMPPLRKFVVPMPYPIFFTLLLLERQRSEGRQDFRGQPVGEIRMWYPLAVSPGTLAPDGGGFWLVYPGYGNGKLKYDPKMAEL